MFSRIQSSGKIIDSSIISIQTEIKKSFNERNFNMLPFDSSSYGLFNGNFVPPPPRMPIDEIKDVISDGLTTCDLCDWASMNNDKTFFSLEGHRESSKNDISWVVLLISVSVCSALFGAIVMILTLRLKRNASIGAFLFEKQGISSTTNLDTTHNSKLELKKIDESSNVDLAFFMEQEENLYATLDDHDHDSISSENINNSFSKTTYMRNDETDMPLFSSAPSSAYYSDLSNHIEKPYENIESFNLERTDIITINHNRLSAISENNSGSRNNCNSEYV
ncbi:uncharacterized protein [Chironomus tepperi]|uniref:uncharacterized protein isoform X2 n=1 Tax=Chironomus tepperi TaxID=113505 RepID=UPI00391EE325